MGRKMGDGSRENRPELDRWHLLFDALCNRSGDYDNARLGSDYCSRLGRRGEAHFETAVRNLRNWRSGRHIPRRRNFMILTELLDVARDPELLARWNALYARAREMEEGGSGDDQDGDPADAVFVPAVLPAAAVPTPVLRRFDGRSVLAGLALFCCGVVAAELYRAAPWHWFYAVQKPPLIVWRPHVSLMVGESLVIHGERGDCGKPPPDWEYVLTRLPISRIGTFSDGGIVRRNSNFCRGETPARAVTFTAGKPGVEELLVLGDVMRVTVAEPAS
ncbi:hypothetical protein ACFOHH_11460 [Shinella pollutisoli]|uniref:Uncharacterized protein n=2 Tax=Shinella pollutisoli TaxID=2250594 RepID=A0ABV7DH99_9HYPH